MAPKKKRKTRFQSKRVDLRERLFFASANICGVFGECLDLLGGCTEAPPRRAETRQI